MKEDIRNYISYTHTLTNAVVVGGGGWWLQGGSTVVRVFHFKCLDTNPTFSFARIQNNYIV